MRKTITEFEMSRPKTITLSMRLGERAITRVADPLIYKASSDFVRPVRPVTQLSLRASSLAAGADTLHRQQQVAQSCTEMHMQLKVK